ncbi:topless-related protein 4-like [Carica papaya]|uniref:topless-related protein 4-like n=1 Tax=Carica papaya TaxID=3649 RepID=UPI000B8D117E|nr:topless-related protein 4-like [Carica papaya]
MESKVFQLCVWSMDKWMKQAAKFLQIPPVTLPDHLSHTRAHFHQDQIHVLAVHTTQISIHEAPKLECLAQWVPRVSSGLITDAVYSCDSQSVYACLEDGTVNILTATTKSFELRCRVDPSAYLPSNPSLIHPVVVVSHPSEPNQFAVGLTDGRVHVLEPLESEGKWGTSNPVDDAGPSSSSAAGSDQQPR